MSMYVSSLRSSLTFPARAICLALVGCGGGDPPEETRNGRFHLDAPSATTREDFAAFGLDEGWTFWDGYAEAEPTDVDNHVQLSLDGTHLELSFPPGAEHNQWWLEHAEVTRPFEGSGIYETKMDTGIGSQQFGLVFQSAPGTFLMFMLYGHGELWGYVERFVTVDGYTHKTTFPGSATDGYNTGFSVPDAGPYHLRVTLRDAEDPSARFWNFQWSRDGDNWDTILSGALESGSEEENIGEIASVGVFMGNQPPSPFDGFTARFDHYNVYPVELSVQGGDGEAELGWFPVAGADGYRVYRSDVDGGPYDLVASVSEPGFLDQGLPNGDARYYVVTSYDSGPEVGYSLQVKAVPQAPPTLPSGIPLDGIVLALDAASLDELSDGSPVEQWLDASPSGYVASAAAASAPTYSENGFSGHPALVFDGVDDYLALSEGFDDFTAGMTAFVVARPSVLQDGFKLVALGNGAGQQNIVLGRAGSGNGLQYFTNDQYGSFGWFNSSDGLSAGSGAVYGVVEPGGAPNSLVNAVVTVDGIQVGGGYVYVPPVVERQVNYLGRSYWSEGQFQGELAEVLVYDRELDAQERSSVHEYLADKYDIGSAPAGLPAPASLQVNEDDGTVTLTFDAVDAASEYAVHRSTTPGGSFGEIATISNTSYSDSDVAPGATYYYHVTARDGVDESEASETVSITLAPEAPNLPEGLPANGLGLFLDASTLDLADGEPVDEWLDSSGWGNDAVAGTPPTFSSTGFNGHPAVQFDGTDDHFELPAGFDDFTDGLSLFVVAEVSGLQPGFKLLALGNGPGVDHVVLGRAGSTSGLQYFTNSSNNATGWFNTSAALAVGEPSVFGVFQPGGSVDATVTATVTVDGVSVGSGSVYVPDVISRTSNTIGKSPWAEGYFQGQIAELVLYNRQLSSGERAGVQTYFDGKYDLTEEPQPLAAPGSVQANADAGQVTVSFADVDGADEYVVYRSEDANGPFSAVGATSGTSYVDTDVAAGATYFYYVTARDAVGESVASAIVSASLDPAPLPELPQGLPSASLALFLDAGSLALDDGDPVTEWLDLSGSGHDAVAGSSPLFWVTGLNGRPAVQFDGVDDHFALSAGFEDFTDGMSLFMVAELAGLTPGFKLFALGNGAGLDNIVLGRAGSTDGLQYFTNSSQNAVGWFDTPNGFTVGQASVFGVVQPGGAVDSMVNTVVTVDGVGVGGGSVFVPNVITRTSNTIGKSPWAEGYFQGQIAEVLLYERKLSASEQSDVHGYLDTKYGL